MAEIRDILEKEKDTNNSYLEQAKPEVAENEPENLLQMARCWKKLSVQFQQRTENALLISSKLLHVNRLLARLPASQMANIRPCFDIVFAEAAIAFNKIANGIKIQSVENQSHLMSLLPS